MLVIPVVVTSLVALSTANHIQSRHPRRHESDAHDHEDHAEKRGLPTQWYHRDDHPVHELFGRAASTDGSTYAAVGSPEWLSAFSEALPPKEQLPAAWFAALDAAVAAGKIPNIAPSTQPNGPDNNPVYTNSGGLSGEDPSICSQTYQCKGEGVIFDAPDGVFATSFDDGPTEFTGELLDFLGQNNVKTTHFMIGKNIYDNHDAFLGCFNAGDDIAVHTWTHPHMTTLTNEQIVAELGYTMLIIRNSTGGRVPRYWRPPYGDADNRVNAIANQVFGLTTIKWNQDPEDWSIDNVKVTVPSVEAQLKGWITGPKSPGLIILEHELLNETVQAFKDVFPLIKQNGWDFRPVTQLYNDKTPYKNADATGNGNVGKMDVLGAVNNNVAVAVPSGASSAGPPASSSSSPSSASQPASAPSSPAGSSTSSAPSETPTNKPSAAAPSWTRSGLLTPTILSSLLIFALVH